MALPISFRRGFSPADIEFEAEELQITITPTHKIDKLQFLHGDYGPFIPPRRTQVPLWLAITLKTKGKCQISPPEWMDVVYLKNKLELERRDMTKFLELPYHWVETAQILLDCARENIPQADKIQSLLKDLRETRQSKAREGLKSFNTVQTRVDNFGLMEINEVRPFFVKAFSELQRLDPDGLILMDIQQNKDNPAGGLPRSTH